MGSENQPEVKLDECLQILGSDQLVSFFSSLCFKNIMAKYQDTKKHYTSYKVLKTVRVYNYHKKRFQQKTYEILKGYEISSKKFMI